MANGLLIFPVTCKPAAIIAQKFSIVFFFLARDCSASEFCVSSSYLPSVCRAVDSNKLSDCLGSVPDVYRY